MIMRRRNRVDVVMDEDYEDEEELFALEEDDLDQLERIANYLRSIMFWIAAIAGVVIATPIAKIIEAVIS
jgi:hypothetical protein